jgi:hypothetical protein
MPLCYNCSLIFSINNEKVIEMSKYARRVDENQGEIVTALRDYGATVRVVTQGDGLPDLLVGYTNPDSLTKYTLLLEVKDGNKPPSARKLTPPEEKFFFEWTGGLLAIVESAEEAIDILKHCR